MSRLETLLRPSSVAVVGASDDTATYGGRVWRYLRRDFGGSSMAVNRRASAVSDAPLAASLGELPSVPDVVVLAIPAHAVLDVLEEAGALGVRGAVVLARDLLGCETELQALASRREMVLLGPNCLGLVNANDGVSLSSSVSLEAPPRPGRLALIAQSGALMGTLHARAAETGLGIGVCVSTGSQAVVRVEDVMLELAGDERIDTVGVYSEDVDPPRFAEAALALRERGAVVIALKGGLTRRGSLITASHSGALASDGRAFRQLAGELGVVVVDDPQELLTTLAFGCGTGSRWFLATVSGGLSAIAADRAVAAGVELPEPQDDHVLPVGLKPPYNPLDLEASDTSETEKVAAVAALARCDAADGVLVVVNDMPGLELFLERLRTKADGRIVLCSECSSQFTAALQSWVAGGGWYTTGLAQSLSAVGRLNGGGRRWAEPDLSVDEALLAPGDLVALLEEEGVPVLPVVEVRSEQEALRVAAEIGYPVVVKVARVTHRGDGVRLGLAGPEDVAAAVAELGGFVPLLVQPQAPPGLELYVGVFRDATFGWELLVAPGGRDVEALGDVAVVPADQLERGIEEILGRTATGRWLLSGLGRGLLDLDGLMTTAKGALRVADALGARLIALDLNPVVVNEQGALVVDAKALVASQQASTSRSKRAEGLDE